MMAYMWDNIRISEKKIVIPNELDVFALYDEKEIPLGTVKMRFRYKIGVGVLQIMGFEKTKGGPVRFISGKYSTKMSQIFFWRNPSHTEIDGRLFKVTVPTRVELRWDDKRYARYKEENRRRQINSILPGV